MNYHKYLINTSIIVNVWLLIGALFSIKLTIIPIAIVFGLISYYKPLLGFSLILFLLPIFGGRPSVEQAHYLIIITAIFLLVNYKNFNKLLKKKISSTKNINIIFFFIFLYIFISCLSLIGLPILGLIQKSFQLDPLYIFSEILKVGETTLFVSFQSVLYSFQAILFASWFSLQLTSENYIKYITIVFTSLIFGLLLSLLFGYFDYFNYLSLSDYRTIDQASIYRFSSFFTNSTWYSQYLILTIPTILVLLSSNRKNIFVISVMLLLMIISEVALILSMQRGGWITYPIILFIIWLSIYYSIESKKGKNIKLLYFLEKNWIKVTLTIPITVILSVFIVAGIKDYQKNHGITPKSSIEQTTKRAKEAFETNDRIKYFPPAIKIWTLNPIYGGGGDSFGWQYKIYYHEKNAQYKNDKTNTLKGSPFGTAHNLYLQTLVGRGLLGLIALLGTLLFTIGLLIKSINSHKNFTNKVFSLITISGLISIMIYGNVQEIFYSQPSQIIFWIYIFIGIFLIQSIKIPIIDYNYIKYTIKILLILIIIHFLNISYIKDFISRYINIFQYWGIFTYTALAIAILILAIKKGKVINA